MSRIDKPLENDEEILYIAKNSKDNLYYIVISFIIITMLIFNIVNSNYNYIKPLVYSAFFISFLIHGFLFYHSYIKYKNTRIYLTKTELVIQKNYTKFAIPYKDIKSVNIYSPRFVTYGSRPISLIISLNNSKTFSTTGIENVSELICKIKEFYPYFIYSGNYMSVVGESIFFAMLYCIFVPYVLIKKNCENIFVIALFIIIFIVYITDAIKKSKDIKKAINIVKSSTKKIKEIREKENREKEAQQEEIYTDNCPICGNPIPLSQNICPNCKIYHR